MRTRKRCYHLEESKHTKRRRLAEKNQYEMKDASFHKFDIIPAPSTRKNCKCHVFEVESAASCAASSPKIAYSDRSRLKKFDQQEGKRQKRTGKRQKRTKEKSFFTFDMACYEDIQLLKNKETEFLNMLEEVCNGEDCSMGNFSDPGFWEVFAVKLGWKTGLPEKNCNADLCKRLCEELRLTYQNIKRHSYNPRGYIANLTEAYKKQLFRIFGGKTPSTSTRSSRSSLLRHRSGNCTSSGRAGRGLEQRIHSALADLVRHKMLEFDDSGLAYDFITKTPAHSEIFLELTMAERAELVDEGLKKKKPRKYSQETEVAESL